MKKKLSLSLFAIFILISCFYGYRFYITEPVVIESHGMATFVKEDPHELMDHSTHVFVGQVTENKGTFEPHSLPNTLYSVDVIANIKGEMSEKIDVRQLSGYYFHVPTATKYWEARDGEKPYEEGNVYLFFTNNKNDIEYYTAHAGVGAVSIHDQNQQKELIEEYTQIHKENQGKNEDKGNGNNN